MVPASILGRFGSQLKLGYEKYLIEEIEDYVCFEDGEEFQSIDFWRGVSANPNMVDYFLNNLIRF